MKKSVKSAWHPIFSSFIAIINYENIVIGRNKLLANTS